MKKNIIQHYGADLEWIHSLAEQFEGKVSGNFIIVPDRIHTGTRYFLECSKGIVALYVDVTYNIDLELIQRNLQDDFVGLYFNLSEQEAKLTFDETSNMMGYWSYNLSLIDSSLEFKYNVKAGSKAFIFCIFLKKDIVRSYIQKNNILRKSVDKLMNPQQNTFIRWDRMSNESLVALSDLRKMEPGGVLFDLHVKGTVHLLISNYLEKISKQHIIIHQVNEHDLTKILLAQRFLMENIECQFPTIKAIANMFHMSDSKFKLLFKKITGTTPHSFFMDNKLYRAKDLLLNENLTVTQVSKQLNFSDVAYFSTKFKKKFGILPRVYLQEM